MTHRLIIFPGPSDGFAPSLLDGFLKALESRGEIDSVKICITSRDGSRFLFALRSLLIFSVKTLFNPREARNIRRPKIATVTTVAKRYGAETIEPPLYEINNPAFIRQLESRYEPTIGLSLGCLQIWGTSLLRIFDLAVNFHNGYLPNYKGLGATQWSIYRDEEYSGYAFHLMDKGIDTGPVICRGRVPIQSNMSPAAVDRLKYAAARKDVGNVLDGMISGQVESIVQPKGGSYFSGKDSEKIRTIDDPIKLTSEELHRRVHCFPQLTMQIEDVYYPVTSLMPVGKKVMPLSFVTADDVKLFPDRLRYVPTRLYLAALRLKALKDTGFPR
jgi:methionyl-tRNA formyltransferase